VIAKKRWSIAGAVRAGAETLCQENRTLPTRIEELENTNNIRFLRKRYKDPITGKDFKLLHVGEVQLSSSPGVALGVAASAMGGAAGAGGAGAAALLGAASGMMAQAAQGPVMPPTPAANDASGDSAKDGDAKNSDPAVRPSPTQASPVAGSPAAN